MQKCRSQREYKGVVGGKKERVGLTWGPGDDFGLPLLEGQQSPLGLQKLENCRAPLGLLQMLEGQQSPPWVAEE